jgi:DNA-binding transcriptional regulator YiaG
MTNIELRRLRRHLHLTQVQLAGALGVQPMTVARWEQGVNPISPLAATALMLYAERAATTKARSTLARPMPVARRRRVG